jgi:hypothetical protein
MQLPGGLFGNSACEAAEVGPAVVIFGFVQLPACRTGTDRGQRQHKDNQHRERAASLPLLDVMSFDGPVAFCHQVRLTIA